MYFVGLHNGQKILLNYYMLNIMFQLNLTVVSVEKCLAYTLYYFMYKIIKQI